MKKSGFFRVTLVLGCALAVTAAAAKSPDRPRPDARQRYIVVLEEPPLAVWHGQRQRELQASTEAEGKAQGSGGRVRHKLDVRTPESRAYVATLDQGFERMRAAAERTIGRSLTGMKRYRYALNGMAVSLTAAEAEELAQLPGVKRVQRSRVYKLDTDAGPRWIGAADIWNGVGPLPATEGQGVVIGFVDTGINAAHISFSDPGESGGGWDHLNPYGGQLGLCSDPAVECNDKLVGVYDFVTNLGTTEVDEEYNMGLDNDGHGSHVASIAAGNRLQLTINGTIERVISGVAPNANIVTYRACYIGDPDDTDDDGCHEDFLTDAIEQAVVDGVDVINYSVGTPTVDSPWVDNVAEAFRNANEAGIFVATSTGNLGPESGSINSPANAPWLSAVGYATHNRVAANLLEQMSGGDTPAPDDLVGDSFTAGTAVLPIVYAGDFGNALCGTGTPESQPDCDGNTGASSPFPPGTFNGEIVVCDRGGYGRVEKGKNLLLAGAGGYVLANTDEDGESTFADAHCLPATHIGDQDGDVLRAWLGSGSGHMARISGFDFFEVDAAGDRLASGSSRGPNPPPVQDVLKPNLIAPGVEVLGAYAEDDGGVNNFEFLTGSSMASPHVAGAAALLLAVDDSWTPAMIRSALELTATAEQAIDYDGLPATPLERGGGRPRLGEAANSGLFLDETAAGFASANPALGGDPKELNLPGLVDTDCMNSCSFTRTVTAIAPNRTWTATTEGFPAGVDVTVTPPEFFLAGGADQALDIDIDLEGAGQTGLWVYGDIILSASGVPDARLTVAVYASGGDLPPDWDIASDRDSGWQGFNLAGLVSLPDATYTGGGFSRPQPDSGALPEDPSNSDPYDGGSGVFTVLLEVPDGALWLHAETLASTAPDIDLFVGRDTDGDGLAEESEQVCQSITPENLELCDILAPPAGTWWVLVQNWNGSAAPTDDATVLTAVIAGDGSPGISATGPGIVGAGDPVPVRVAWDDVNAVPGEVLLGAVGVGTDRDHPDNIGVIPVYFTRTGIAEPMTLPLADGRSHSLALGGGSEHDRIFIDIPTGVTGLTVSASGADADQSNALGLELRRMAFDDAFGAAPFALAAPATAPIASASGSGGDGPVVMVSDGQVQPGRWYATLVNGSGTPSSVDIQADVTFGGEVVPIRNGLWQPPLGSPREEIYQGYEYSQGGNSRAFIWYTYGEDHNPTWYLAANLAAVGNIWVADLLRFTNDGAEQQFVKVGRVIITMRDLEEAILSYTLFGESGSEPMVPSAPNTCAMIDGFPRSVIGLWTPEIVGVGGASVLFNDFAHFDVHYLYDAAGNPRWLGASTPDGNDLTLYQYSGFCPLCVQGEATFEAVGVFTHDFASETNGNWTLNYLFNLPLMGNVERTDDILKFTDNLPCD
jgi:subtilisin family serine protease